MHRVPVLTERPGMLSAAAGAAQRHQLALALIRHAFVARFGDLHVAVAHGFALEARLGRLLRHLEVFKAGVADIERSVSHCVRVKYFWCGSASLKCLRMEYLRRSGS